MALAPNRAAPRAASRPPRAPMSREQIVIQEVVARAPEDRPARDTVDEIAEWLVGPARHIASGVASFDEFAWRLLAAGLPLLRVTLHVGTIPSAIPWHHDGVVAGCW